MNGRALDWVRDCTDGSTVDRGDRLEDFFALVAAPIMFPGSVSEVRGHASDSLSSGPDRAAVAVDHHDDGLFVQCKNLARRAGAANR